MIKNTLIIALIILAIYLYYQNRKLKELPTFGSSTQTIFEVGEDQEELIAEKDEAIRKKNEVEAEVLSLSNQLRHKQQEVTRKETEIERLKKEKSSSEIALNKKITEKNGLITTLQREVNQQKEKYSKQGKLLDEEQTDNNKLNEKVEKLEQQITELTRDKSLMPGEFPEEDLIKEHQEQLRKINLLFDENAKDYKIIDFNGLYQLLKEKVGK
jgi:chromosome segregation ATPase